MVTVYLLGLAVLVSATARACDGRVVYSLDDPYIHLSVAESILGGGYGVNPGEHAAPSSSILYPFLLAATTGVGLGALGPLVLDAIAGLATALLVARFVATRVAPSVNSGARGTASTVALVLACCAAMNAWGLVLTGMEHSWHVLASVAILARLARAPTEELDAWLVAATVAAPLLRFEGIAMAGVALALMVARRQRREAALAACLLVLAGAAWVIFTQQRGLPWLPSSVLTKSELAASALEARSGRRIVAAFFGNLADSAMRRQGVVLGLAGLALLGGAARAWRRGQPTLAAPAACAGATALAHVVFGRFGWFSRYEVYAVAGAVMATLVMARSWLVSTTSRSVAAAALFAVAFPYVVDAARSPEASRGTYGQQYQMHRFVVEHWRRPVAANDIGWLSYRNPHHVLDLWGLGSEETRRVARRRGLGSEVIAELVAQRGIELAIVYHEKLLQETPAGWQRVGVLFAPTVTGADDEVGFFTTTYGSSRELRGLLREFAVTLPAGITLAIDG